ncbi:hypothetical protein [Mycobacteroides chelonae]|uniref:hypothetical protein n=1 Tax=Mycobacteroides chelonae TaxID=1774 RepID=UPI001041F216|nr:hypothetical protein [Mycobacteroides chelonae]
MADDDYMSLDEILDTPGLALPNCPGTGKTPENQRSGFGHCPDCRQQYPIPMTGRIPAHPSGIPWQNIDDIWLPYIDGK